ncbi:hypothetical protein J2Z22_002579 [Paenibacillus forsythiae]|uniref:Uncharacterized protein n=1 Tax=Paenibacillus forsythiae TaxID=365616 RepID=A0ABU3H8A0_9BACL|nr:hypothetical protein [Paenibacillus forsythiae]MDT3427045.1 hypothetical protein [Paenibacillus forsythiae]
MRSQGINVSAKSSKDYHALTLEELMETKELIEDIIAEKQSKLVAEAV